MKNNNSYYAVIFTSTQTKQTFGYEEMALKMESLAKKQNGFIGIESARNSIGITISYWESLEAIKEWKTNYDHLVAQKKGLEEWYESYKVRICKVEREYEFEKNI